MITINGKVAEDMNYPDGTKKLTIPGDISHTDGGIHFVWKYEEEMELIKLHYLASQIKTIFPGFPLTLFMPYLPNARMDRIHEQHEVFTLKYFCEIINSIGFSEISVLDVHSSVGIALLKNGVNLSPEKYIRTAIEKAQFNTTDCLFFPDEGSQKRYASMLPEFKNVAFGIKERDWDNGQIKGLTVHGCDVKDRDVFIVDDICAYGGTVYHSALKLKELGCNNIYVFFTHCENSIAKGKLFSCGLIDKIYTTDSICTLGSSDIMEVFTI